MTYFIAIEGIDASGKHTQTERLKNHFDNFGFNVRKFSLPSYNSVTGDIISAYLAGDWKVELSDNLKNRDFLYTVDPSTYMFQCAQLANRMESLPDELWKKDNLNNDNIFIADRYNTSAYAYGAAFGLDVDWLIKTHRHLPEPDITLFLDISVDESFRRRPNRRDEYEKNRKMLNDVREKYIEIFNKLGSRYSVIDATGSEDEVFNKILSYIKID